MSAFPRPKEERIKCLLRAEEKARRGRPPGTGVPISHAVKHKRPPEGDEKRRYMHLALPAHVLTWRSRRAWLDAQLAPLEALGRVLVHDEAWALFEVSVGFEKMSDARRWAEARERGER